MKFFDKKLDIKQTIRYIYRGGTYGYHQVDNRI